MVVQTLIFFHVFFYVRTKYSILSLTLHLSFITVQQLTQPLYIKPELSLFYS